MQDNAVGFITGPVACATADATGNGLITSLRVAHFEFKLQLC